MISLVFAEREHSRDLLRGLHQKRVAFLAGLLGGDQPERRPAAAGPLVALFVGVFFRNALAFARPALLADAAFAERQGAAPIAERQAVPLDQRDQLGDFLVGFRLDGHGALFERADL